MMPNERCPYCKSENVSYEGRRLDYVGEMLIETEFCTCENCKKDFNIEVDYTPIARRYYNSSTSELLRKEESQDE